VKMINGGATAATISGGGRTTIGGGTVAPSSGPTGGAKSFGPKTTSRSETRLRWVATARRTGPRERTLCYPKWVLGEGPMRGLEFTY
jgi:hypothetical protein